MKKIILLGAILVSCASYAQVFTSFEEPEIFSGDYTDTGDPNVAHSLINNLDEPLVNYISTGGEIGFNASYEPYDTPGDGLTDGDDVGVTDNTPTGSIPYTEGIQGYQISDVDGNYILEFETVDLTGANNPTLSIDYFLSETGYEGDGTVNQSSSDRLRIYVKDLTNATEIDILDTTGSNINDLNIEGFWITGTAILLPDTTIQLVIEARTNSGAETFYFDHIIVEGILNFIDQSKSHFSMFPNPTADDFINITSKLAGDKTIIIYNVLGKQVIHTTISKERLDISSIKSGVYIVKIIQGLNSVTKKLVIH